MTNKNAIGILLLVWAIVELLIFPIGEFPLNDDWCYAIPVRDLINGEKLRIVNWGSMTLLTQIGWGYLFSTIFGFSFLTLRISVIILGITGGIYLYYLLEKNTKNNYLALFLALVYVLNPLHISLSNTFMTDVPFCTFSIVSLFYIKKMFDSDFDLKYVVLVNILLI
ncbi:MAG: phospholipid carrier-dependent glycosyltransferase [Bacteroidetes bacterium]|nr:MAG: phospholipid carrier-dependent glycosyltransferase [Bacteroidota bacterium]